MNRATLKRLLGLGLLTLASCGPAAVYDVGLSATAETAPAIPTVFEWFPPSPTPSPEALSVPLPTPNRRPGIGRLLLLDDFSSPSAWNAGTSDQAGAALTERGMTIAVQPRIGPVTSFRQGTVFGDSYTEVVARPGLCRGSDSYGLLFHAPNNIAYYRFALTCDGEAGADRVSLGSTRVLKAPVDSADAPTGAPSEVKLGVWAAGGEFRFFLNDRYQFAASDKSYPSGGIGVFAQAAGQTPVIVTFSNLAVYAVEFAPPAVATP